MADLKTRGGAELERDPEDLERIKVMMRRTRRRNFLFQLVAELVAAPATAVVQPFMFRAALNVENTESQQSSTPARPTDASTAARPTDASPKVEVQKDRTGHLYPHDIESNTNLRALVSWERWAVPAAIQIAKSTFEYSLTSILLWLQPHIEDETARQILMSMRAGEAPTIVPISRLPLAQIFAIQLSSAVLFFKLEQASLFLSTRDETEQRSVLELWSRIGFSSMALVLTAVQGFQSPIYLPWATLLLADYIDRYDPVTLVNKTDVTSRAATLLRGRTLTTCLRGYKSFLRAYFTPRVLAYSLAAGIIKNVGQMSSYFLYVETLQTIQNP
eukprot:TRINITY_DN611_c0_g1_i1.p1 TRINITY_DN611_c0_g1~~TRINITY_DN611_c0_g1_i1.p1  ORF type:complete len:357 (+),score=110.58 TRINITY_DN611_c0_g1_i1:80-1072(+)